MVCGLAALALMPAHPEVWNIVWRMSLCGVGFGLFNSPNNRTMIAAAPASRSGGASGMLATGRLFGQTMGAALVALVFGLLASGSITGLARARGLLLGGGGTGEPGPVGDPGAVRRPHSGSAGWGGRIRTSEWRNQNPLPYHLATPHQA